MMVLITYDVKTETEAGKSRLRRVLKNVRIMVNVCKILFLNVSLIRRS